MAWLLVPRIHFIILLICECKWGIVAEITPCLLYSPLHLPYFILKFEDICADLDLLMRMQNKYRWIISAYKLNSWESIIKGVRERYQPRSQWETLHCICTALLIWTFYQTQKSYYLQYLVIKLLYVPSCNYQLSLYVYFA